MILNWPFTLIALAISPIVAVIFVSLYWFKRDPVSQPSIVAVIPLGLTSIAILLGQGAVILLETFNEIATRRAAGLGAVIAGLLRAERPLAWGLLDFAACLVIVFLFSAFLRYSRDEETPVIRAYVSLPALIITAVVIVVLFLMVYLQYSTVDLVMMIVDKHRSQELTSIFGTVDPGYFAARISSRLVIIAFMSVFQFIASIVAGVLDLSWRQKLSSRQTFATVLTLGALVGCGASALSEFGFIDYLVHVH
jgi:hypothetical protein